jgi:hypothetical protein
MKYFKGFTLVLFFLVLYISASGQLTSDLYRLYHPAYFQQNTFDTTETETWNVLSPSKPSYSFEVGSSFSSYGGGFSSSYFSPTVSFMATERLHVVAGGKFSYANFSNAPALNSQVGQSASNQAIGNPTEAFAYGMYQVNSKLSIYGMGSFGKNQVYMSPFGAGFGTTDYQHLSFGMDYKISDKFRVGASFGYTNGPAWGLSPNSNYRNQPFNPFFP